MSAIAVQPRIVTVRSQVGLDGAARTVASGGRPAARSTSTRPAPSRPAAPARPARRRPVAARAAFLRSGVGRPAPLHLTRRGRVVVVLLGLLVAFAGVLGGRAVADSPERGLEVVSYSVQAGETLWQIATGVAQPGEDVRDVVQRLQDLNNMRDGSLTAGEVIVVPAAD